MKYRYFVNMKNETNTLILLETILKKSKNRKEQYGHTRITFTRNGVY